MKIAIVGFGREGQSSYRYFSKDSSNQITICDKNPGISLPANVNSQLGDKYLDNLAEFDLIVRTSGLNPDLITTKSPGIESKVTTQLNEFMSLGLSNKVIGVTGTKGKGTTSTLIHKIFIESGSKSVLAGNIGVPFLDILDSIDSDTFVVLELSSFQLSDFKSKSPHVAVCLMVVEEHINWHGSLDKYLDAKARLFINQTEKDISIYLNGNAYSKRIVERGKATKIPYFEPPGAYVKDDRIVIDDNQICKTSEVKLLGKHNLENICAAITASWQYIKDINAIKRVVTTFVGLEHRIEFVKELNGIKYYNDSFASSLSATVAAIEAIAGAKVLIIGGYERMINIDKFCKYVKDNNQQFRNILIIGESALRLKEAFESAGVTNFVLGSDLGDMSKIVKKASSLASVGDSVILSPGFASFDMFKDFEDRGDQFKEAVNKL